MIGDQVPETTTKPADGPVGAVLVVGSGIGGIQSALELAEAGFKVYMVEDAPAIGGVMAKLDKTFPTNDCSMCILSPKLVGTGRHPNVEIITNAQVENLIGEAGNFKVSIRRRPRYVNEEKCTGCGACIQNCPVTKALHPVERPPSRLSEEERRRVEAIVLQHRGKQSQLMPILQEVDREFSHLPAAVLDYLAKELGIPVTSIYSIATFYSAFSLKPRGRHKISVCLGTTCYVRGGERIIGRLHDELGIKPGETTEDGRFTLESVRCLGCCSLAPAIMIDGRVYGRIKHTEAAQVLRKYV